MTTIIGLKELRENMEAIIAKVNQRGEPVIVVSRSKPVFKIYPANYQEGENSKSIDAWADDYIAKHKKLLDSLADK